METRKFVTCPLPSLSSHFFCTSTRAVDVNKPELMLQEVAESVALQIRGKADAAAFTVLEQSVSKRASEIEAAMLKGLRTVSEKAASALAQKLHREVLPPPGASK
jgi:hypothetical protein